MLGAPRWPAAWSLLTLVSLAGACGDASQPAADAGGGRGGARPTIVLNASDVHAVERTLLEATIPLAGDLRPIEEIVIRARSDGDVLNVLVREGDAVAEGAVLARFDIAEAEAADAAARAEVAAADAEVAVNTWNLEQARELFRVGAIAEQALKASEQLAVASASRQAAAAARARTTALALRDAVVVSPAAGTIGLRSVQSGERVSRGAALFTVVRDDSLELAAAVPARQASALTVGQSVRFTADARELRGRIARISPSVDPVTRAVTVYVRLGNAGRALRANTFANGRVVSETRADVLAVPRDAIRQGQADAQPFVYRIEGEDIAVVPVRLGATDESRGVVEVLEGLAIGDRVIVGNVGTIGRGMRVQLVDGDRRDPSAR